MIKIKLSTLEKKGKLAKISDILVFISSEVLLAGGALRTCFDENDILKDFDIFFTNKEAIAKTKDKLTAAGFENIFTCPLELLFTFVKDDVKIQLICENIFNNPADLLNSFDIMPGCFATDGEFVYFPLDALRCVKYKRLTLNNVSYPVSTFNRIIKYKEKGYQLYKAPRQFVEMVSASDFRELDMRVYID